MISTCTRIDPSKWRFFVDRIERQRRTAPLNVKHLTPCSKIIAALAVLALTLLAATEKVEAAPYSRDTSYGFSESISAQASP